MGGQVISGGGLKGGAGCVQAPVGRAVADALREGCRRQAAPLVWGLVCMPVYTCACTCELSQGSRGEPERAQGRCHLPPRKM